RRDEPITLLEGSTRDRKTWIEFNSSSEASDVVAAYTLGNDDTRPKRLDLGRITGFDANVFGARQAQNNSRLLFVTGSRKHPSEAVPLACVDVESEKLVAIYPDFTEPYLEVCFLGRSHEFLALLRSAESYST